MLISQLTTPGDAHLTDRDLISNGDDADAALGHLVRSPSPVRGHSSPLSNQRLGTRLRHSPVTTEFVRRHDRAGPKSEGESLRIARLDVEGGFLDGISIEFSPGLNVLIGSRGVGKTSVIETLRFVLGAPFFTAEARERSKQQITSILAGGAARITLVDDKSGGEVTVTRSVRDSAPQSQGDRSAITVLAQNEVEAVGAQPHGRLALLDRFSQVDVASAEVTALLADLRSLGREAQVGTIANDRLDDRAAELQHVPSLLAAATDEQQQALANVQATEADKQALERLRQSSAAVVSQRELVSATLEASESAGRQLLGVLESFKVIEHLDLSKDTSSQLGAANDHLRRARSGLDQAILANTEARAELNDVLAHLDSQQSVIDIEARALRTQLEALQTGLGEITRRVDELREQMAHLESIKEQIAGSQAMRVDIARRRRTAFTALERVRAGIAEGRIRGGEQLSQALAPHIRMTVRPGASHAAVTDALVSLLKGSGIHYNTLAPQLLTQVSALELAELVDAADPRSLAQKAGITDERAQAVTAFLHDQDLGSLLTAPVHDAADLWLLDGGDYKPASELSIGQRCAAVLPILLRSESDVVIVDQPEDHLDNGFIGRALTEFLRRRSGDAQFIFASHNANIPVLGEADRIVHLQSDGRRGFVVHQGPLDDPQSVRAVTEVMEGGREAFQRRAAFYGDRP